MYFVNSMVVLSPPISLVFTPDLTKSNIVDSNLLTSPRLIKLTKIKGGAFNSFWDLIKFRENGLEYQVTNYKSTFDPKKFMTMYEENKCVYYRFFRVSRKY